ncbi:MAG TPA: 3-dehydroquinate synthase [Cyanobacteria bacterium UBA11991]|nr:3-dehydroquinate synthase [Cyanobacteriota bacterium]MDY6359194.1 3-dehydroquinate synthase [Cyanobacteriota bacterium]MDY6364675.1 3-dehydroquinate synthase [Cyanobacteriota bacterium]MDY6383742.1 3-dehydroquinate synthase [Cyanobacteriota bacterium]HCB10899.1 3-dehydroquinate synthase [Cyanobacteria bacterium UBA11991]
MCKLEVNIKNSEKNYPIFINNRDIETLKQTVLDYIGEKNYIVVISSKVYKLYSSKLNFDKHKIFILKDGEKEKNIKNYTKILQFILKHRLTREDAVIAIGGGVVGDIAGFAASTYMRGIKYIQVPTTLLACTDSSVGGKTAIDTSYGKNLVGTFYQPDAVFININFLKTLSKRQFKSGLGEVVKYAFIEKSCGCGEDLNLMNFLSNNKDKILNYDVLTLKELVEICIKLKTSVVNQDEKESGLRKILNYGHTYGHAVENYTKYKKYTHGECVVAGILFALNFALKLNKIDKEYQFICQDLIKNFDFTVIPKFNKNKILKIMMTDKKASDDAITFILPTGFAQVKAFKFSPEDIIF